MKLGKVLTILLLAAGLFGCSIMSAYRPSIEQGNVYTPENIAKLKIGMSKQQVAYIMGNSILESIFIQDSWDYVHTFQPKGSDIMYKKYLTLYFDDNQLTDIAESKESKLA